MGKDSYHEGCSSADKTQNVPNTSGEQNSAEVTMERQVGEQNAYQYQHAAPQMEQAGEQNANQYQYAAPQAEQAGEQNGKQYQYAASQAEPAGEQNAYQYQYAAPQAEMKPEAPVANPNGQGMGPVVRQGAPAGYPGPHTQGGKPEGVMAGGNADAHSCSCGEQPSPGMPFPGAPMYGPQPGMPFPGMPMFGPQPGMPFPGAPMYGPQPGMPSPGAPMYGPQPGMPHAGAPMYGPQPGMPFPEPPMYGSQPDTHDHAAGGGCSGKKGGGQPGAFPGGQMPGYTMPGMAPGYGSMDPQHLENRYGQIMAMCNDFMQGKADPVQVMTFLNSTGSNFWKGALIGAAATFLLTNDGVKSALRETFSSLSSGKSQSE